MSVSEIIAICDECGIMLYFVVIVVLCQTSVCILNYYILINECVHHVFRSAIITMHNMLNKHVM